MDSKRAVRQLEKISSLLDSGYKVCYMIVSLNSVVKSVRLNPMFEEYCNAYKECLSKGMQCVGFSVKLRKMQPEIYGRVEIKL